MTKYGLRAQVIAYTILPTIIIGGLLASYFSFHRYHVHQVGSLQVERVFEGLDEPIKSMALYGANVLELKGLKKHSRGEEGDKGILTLPNKIQNVIPHTGNRFQEIVQLPPEGDKPSTRHFSADKG